MARKRKSLVAAAQPPRQVLEFLAQQSGCFLPTVGDFEQLAGVNIQSEVERGELWVKFRHLFSGPTHELFDVAMDYCAAIALRRIQAGELCLIRTRFY